MKTIYKYVINRTGFTEMQVPEDHKILCVKSQRSRICVWMEVNDPVGTPAGEDIKMADKKFVVYKTGRQIDENLNLQYLGSVDFLEAELMYHVYEVLP